MPYLMQISVDNNRRLIRKSYLFEYRGRQFKFVQDDPRKWSDHLMTVLPTGKESERREAFSLASEVSAIAWELDARVAL